MRRTVGQIMATVRAHRKSAEKGTVKVSVVAWDIFLKQLEELEHAHNAELDELRIAMTPKPPPEVKKKTFVNGRLVR